MAPPNIVHPLARVAQEVQLLVLPAVPLQLYTTILAKLIGQLVLTILLVYVKTVYLLAKAAQIELHVIFATEAHF